MRPPKKPSRKEKVVSQKRPAKKAKAGLVRASAPRLAVPGKAAPVPGPVARTQAEWRRFLDDVVDRANRAVKRSGLEHETAADLLFEALFEGDVEAALDPESRPTEAYARVLERAGASLRLDAPDLSRHVRIGALNQLRRDGVWLDMDWSKKVELLPLLAIDDQRKSFNEGVSFAVGPNVGVRHVREHVQQHVKRLPGSTGRPRNSDEFTLSAGTRFTGTGVLLKSEEHRKAFATRLDKAPPERRRELIRDLRETFEGLRALLDELDEQDD